MPAKWRRVPEAASRIEIQAGRIRYLVGIIENGLVPCPHCHHKMPGKKPGMRSCYHCSFEFYASYFPVPPSL